MSDVDSDDDPAAVVGSLEATLRLNRMKLDELRRKREDRKGGGRGAGVKRGSILSRPSSDGQWKLGRTLSVTKESLHDDISDISFGSDDHDLMPKTPGMGWLKPKSAPASQDVAKTNSLSPQTSSERASGIIIQADSSSFINQKNPASLALPAYFDTQQHLHSTSTSPRPIRQSTPPPLEVAGPPVEKISSSPATSLMKTGSLSSSISDAVPLAEAKSLKLPTEDDESRKFFEALDAEIEKASVNGYSDDKFESEERSEVERRRESMTSFTDDISSSTRRINDEDLSQIIDEEEPSELGGVSFSISEPPQIVFPTKSGLKGAASITHADTEGYSFEFESSISEQPIPVIASSEQPIAKTSSNQTELISPENPDSVATSSHETQGPKPILSKAFSSESVLDADMHSDDDNVKRGGAGLISPEQFNMINHREDRSEAEDARSQRDDNSHSTDQSKSESDPSFQKERKDEESADASVSEKGVPSSLYLSTPPEPATNTEDLDSAPRSPMLTKKSPKQKGSPGPVRLPSPTRVQFSVPNYSTFEDYLASSIKPQDAQKSKPNTKKNSACPSSPKKFPSRSSSPEKSKSKSPTRQQSPTSPARRQQTTTICRSPDSHVAPRFTSKTPPRTATTGSPLKKLHQTSSKTTKSSLPITRSRNPAQVGRPSSPERKPDEPAKKPSSQEDVMTLEVVESLRKEVENLRSSLATATSERDRAVESAGFAESVVRTLEDELASLRTQGVTGAVRVVGDAEIQKEFTQLETLIHGYQVENEKLVAQVKQLKSQLKETERRGLIRAEAHRRELAALKATVETATSNAPLDAARLAVRVEELESKLQKSMAHEAELEKSCSDLRSTIIESRNAADNMQLMLDDARAAVNERDKWRAERVKMEGTITELRLLLEQETERRDVLASEIDRLEGRSHNRGAKRPLTAKRSAALQKGFNSSPAASSEMGYLRILKDRLLRFEGERDALESTWDNRLKTLQSESQSMKQSYEARIAELHSLLDQANAAKMERNSEAAQAASAKAQSRVSELESQLENLLKSYDTRLRTAVGGGSIELERARKEEAELRASFRTKEKTLLARIGELEAVIDSQAATLESIRSERAAAERDLAVKLKERDNLIANYEDKINALRGEFHQKIFGSDEQRWIEEVKTLRTEIETLRGQNSSLTNQLEISEGTRKAVHESTVTILRQAQEESAKLALAHHERALGLLRDETRAQTSAAIEGEMQRLRSSIAEASAEAARWRARTETLEREKASHLQASNAATDAAIQVTENRIKELEAHIAELEKDRERLAADLARARESWPLDRRRFEELESTLKSFEARSANRESELQKIIDSQRNEAEEEVNRVKATYVPLLRKKEDELRRFKVEMDLLVESLAALRNAEDYDHMYLAR